MRRFWRRIVLATLGRRRFEDEMAREMAEHLAFRCDDLRQQGLSAEEAERQARLEFGSIEAHKEACREARRLDYGDEFLRNWRHAARLCRRSPALTAVVVGTLALGIGANIAIFSAVDVALFRPLPFPEPDRLALVETRIGQGQTIHARRLQQDGATWKGLSESVESIDLAVFTDWTSAVNIEADGRVDSLNHQRIGTGFFRVLGITPAIGREFSTEDDLPGGPPVAIIQHALWRDLFDEAPDILERHVLLRGEPYQIVGVLPESFRSPHGADLFTPLRATTAGEGEGTNYQILGRLRSLVPWPTANAEIRQAGLPRTAQAPTRSDRETWLGLVPLQEGMNQTVRSRLLIALATAWLVMLISGLNVAGLLVAHAARRTHEIRTRMALGGGRGAIVKQLLTESLFLTLLGSAFGLLLGFVGIRFLSLWAAGPLQLWQPLTIDSRVLGVTLMLAIFAVLISGLSPALSASRLSLQGARTSGGSTLGLSQARRTLVTLQLAVVVALLAGAGLMIRTLHHLYTLDPGFGSDGSLAASVSLDDVRTQRASEATRLLEAVVERLEQNPEVEAAGAGLNMPFERPLNIRVVLSGNVEPQTTNLTYVTPGYFKALAIRTIEGRTFDSRDHADAAPTVLVNRAFVRAYLADREPIGTSISLAGAERQIVGVVEDTQQQPGWGSSEPIAPQVNAFIPLAQTPDDLLPMIHTWFQPSWVVRPKASGIPLDDTIRSAIRDIAPWLPLTRLRSINAIRDQALANERFQMILLTSAAAVGLFLAILGLAGLIASSVVERTHEFGVRMALGATSWQTLRAAVRPGLGLTAGGLLLGLPLAFGAAQALGSLIHGVPLFDPVTYLGVVALLLATAAMASVLPCLRLLNLDLSRTLRTD